MLFAAANITEMGAWFLLRAMADLDGAVSMLHATCLLHVVQTAAALCW